MLGHMKEFLWILSNQIDLVRISLDNLLEENFFLPSIDPLSPIIIRIITTQTVLRLFFSIKIYEKRSGIFYPVAYTSVNFSEFSAAKSIKKKMQIHIACQELFSNPKIILKIPILKFYILK